MNLTIEEYQIPVFGIVKIRKSAWYEKFLNGNYYAEIDKESKLITHCESVKEAKEKLKNFIYKKLAQEKDELKNKAKELEAIALKISELELEETEKHHQTLKNKKGRGKK